MEVKRIGQELNSAVYYDEQAQPDEQIEDAIAKI